MQRTPFQLRFSLAGIPVVIEPAFWIVGILMGSNLRGPRIVEWVVLVFISILAHEMGHALAARYFGARAAIRLYSFGGLTQSDRQLQRWQEIAMSLAGPGAGFVLGALSFLAWWKIPSLPSEVRWFLQESLWVNVAWGVMNLLPVPPLDGGHVLQSLLGPQRQRAARIVGGVCAVLVVLGALRFDQIYVAVLFGLLAFQNFQALKLGT